MARRYSKAASRSVHKEMSHRKSGKHGRMSRRRQAIAIGLNKARRAGKKVPTKH